jgi:hypothetical protein
MTEAGVASQSYVFLTQDEKYKHACYLFKCSEWQNSIKSWVTAMIGGSNQQTFQTQLLPSDN